MIKLCYNDNAIQYIHNRYHTNKKMKVTIYLTVKNITAMASQLTKEEHNNVCTTFFIKWKVKK